MINMSSIFNHVARAVAAKSPVILTTMAVTGVVSTTVLGVRATIKATREYDADKEADLLPDDPRERILHVVQTSWKTYIPTTVSAVTTITCIVMGSRISQKRSLALASALTLTENAYREYRENAIEVFGQKKEQSLRDHIARGREDSDTRPEVIITGKGTQLIRDSLSGRYFESDLEAVRAAVNKINAQIINYGYASQTELHAEFGLSWTAQGELLGWSTDQLIDFYPSAYLTDEGVPCLSLEFTTLPKPKYHKVY